jgi:hypothetical protein
MCLSACGSSDPSTPSGVGESDWVFQSTFNKAYAIVKGVDYLPFAYKEDGCYARALYMSMELAANSMESDEVFAFAKTGAPLVVGDLQWGYHVAPMLEVVGLTGLTHMVIDPSLADKPLTQDDWVGLMGFRSDASDHPYMLVVPGSDFAPREAAADAAHYNVDVRNFQSMPAFRASDIQTACLVMYAYIAREGASADATQAKQQKLLARSTALVASLRDVGKLTEDMTFDTALCIGQ